MASTTETPPAAPPDRAANADGTKGFLYALSAYLLWGILPIFLKPLAHIPAPEVLAHRIVWSVPLAGVILLALGRTADLKKAFRSRKTMLMAAGTACLITVNWGVYVWAIASDRAVEAALGYYINPLVSVMIAYFFLGETLSRGQVVAILLAVLAVLIMAFDAGGVPWASLALAVSFAFYGYFKKTLPIGPSQGFFLEVLILALPCLAYIVWLQMTGEGHFVTSRPADMGWLMFTGVITTVPLILYAYGARLLRYSTIGIMQYLAPTIVFLLAIFVFHEPFSSTKAACFALIWVALAIYSWSMLREVRRA